MKSWLKWLLVPIVVLPVVWAWYAFTRPSGISGLEAGLQAAPVAGPIVADEPEAVEADNYLARITLHSEEELGLLFDRIEALLDRPRGEAEQPLVALVLHGPEVEFFALKNYEKYKSLVDRAAKLDALGGLDISVCRTKMKSLGIGEDEVPAFLRQVPFGPGEEQRLLESGFVYM